MIIKSYIPVGSSLAHLLLSSVLTVRMCRVKFGNSVKRGTLSYDNQVKYIYLRYRLLPYIYSMSHQVTANNYTMLRGLAMDFTTDTRTFDIDNAYMFGTSLLVRPVFHPQSEEKNICIYLPEHSGKYWYDFWTGEAFEGGREQMQTNILDILPLYVKAGSILPLAEVKQYAMEYPDRELELRIYGGADAAFLWYEDEGDSYRYEEGVCSKVPMQWKDSERTLTMDCVRELIPVCRNK